MNGKPVYYFVNETGLVFDHSLYPEVGYLALINCVNMTVQGLTLANETDGLLVVSTSDSRIVNNTITGNDYGVEIKYSSNNTVTGNNISGNNWAMYMTNCSTHVISQTVLQIIRRVFMLKVVPLKARLPETHSPTIQTMT